MPTFDRERRQYRPHSKILGRDDTALAGQRCDCAGRRADHAEDIAGRHAAGRAAAAHDPGWWRSDAAGAEREDFYDLAPRWDLRPLRVDRDGLMRLLPRWCGADSGPWIDRRSHPQRDVPNPEKRWDACAAWRGRRT